MSGPAVFTSMGNISADPLGAGRGRVEKDVMFPGPEKPQSAHESVGSLEKSFGDFFNEDLLCSTLMEHW